MMLGSWREVNYRISLFRSIELMLMWCVSVCGGGVAGVYWNECAGIPLADSIVSSFAVARQAKYVAKMSLGVKRSRERSSRRRSDMWGSCSLMLCSHRPPPAQPFARLSNNILHVVVLVSFHPRFWCPRFDSATAVLRPPSAAPPPNIVLLFGVSSPLHSHFLCPPFRLFFCLTFVRWSDSPRVATIATHLNFIGSPVNVPFQILAFTQIHRKNLKTAPYEKTKTKLVKDAQWIALWLVFFLISPTWQFKYSALSNIPFYVINI